MEDLKYIVLCVCRLRGKYSKIEIDTDTRVVLSIASVTAYDEEVDTIEA